MKVAGGEPQALTRVDAADQRLLRFHVDMTS